MKTYHISVEEHGRYGIELWAVCCGTDYSVTICGGTRHHVGVAALGCDESGTEGHENRGATVSVLCAFGHRDDEVARRAAKYLATELKCTVSVSVGIHIDQANRTEIKQLLENCGQACRQFVDSVRANEPSAAGASGEDC